MSSVKKGDIIFHGAKQETYASSIAQTDCYESKCQIEKRAGIDESRWNEIGFRVNSQYIILNQSLDLKAHVE